MADLTKFLTEQFNQTVKHKGTAKRAATQPTVPVTGGNSGRSNDSSALSKNTAAGDGATGERERAPVGESTATAGRHNSAGKKITQMASIAQFTPAQMNQRKLVYATMHDRDVLNAYRELRTRLLQHTQGKNFICMVSSVSADYSATLVATNLAAAIAIDKAKTALLIDCNIYEQAAAQVLGVQPGFGVTDFLDDAQVQLQDIICPTGVPRLRLIPSGANIEYSAEHFSSQRMLEFFDAIKARYSDRYVIVNAPPILASAEAKILADLCDLTVLVLPYGKVVESQLQTASAIVAPDKLAGIVCPPE